MVERMLEAGMSHINVTRQDGLFEITLSRPPLNILHGPMMEELSRAFREAASDVGAKLLLVRAEGKVFSAGADIDEHRPGKADEMIAAFHGMFRLLDSIPFPTLAFVHGAALGGGCELALGCDMIVATERAKFGQPEIGLGFLPPVAAALLPGRVGWGRAVEMCCGGQSYPARECLAMGLVQRVVSDDESKEVLASFISPFLLQSPLTLRLAKKAIKAGGCAGFLERLKAAEGIFLGELMRTEDVREGLAAFDEKRPPAWKNR